MRLLIVLSLVSIMLLGTKPIPEPKIPYTSPELAPYIRLYLMDMTRAGVDVSAYYRLDSIILVPVDRCICNDTDAIGCSDSEKRIIQIKKLPEIYCQDPSFYLKLLVYHEAGHAILKIPDVNINYGPAIMDSEMAYPLFYYKILWTRMRNDYVDMYLFVKAHREYQVW